MAAMLVALATFDGTASAATLEPTGLRFSAPSLTITYGDRLVTIKGTLQTSGQGVADEPINLTEYQQGGTRTDLGTVTTDSNGTFSLTTTLPGLGSIRARFAGDATYGPSNVSTTVEPSTRLPARISVDPLNPVTTGSTLRFTGLVEIQTPDGMWIPAPYTEVACTNGTWNGYWGLTDANGRFSLALPQFGTANSGPQWGVATVDDRASFAANAQSALAPVVLNPAQTRITGFTAGPQPASAQNGLSFTGHADVVIDGQWQGRFPTMNLYFQPRNSTTWSQVTTAWFGAGPNPGDFHIDALSPYLWNGTSYYLAEGSWQVRVEPSKNMWVPFSTDSKAIDVHVQTSVSALYVRRSGTSTRTLAGALILHPGPALETNLPRAVPRKTVKIYYRTKGSSTWHYVTAVTTGSNGAFTYSLTHRPHGYYRVVFTGSGYYNATTSSSVYFGG